MSESIESIPQFEPIDMAEDDGAPVADYLKRMTAVGIPRILTSTLSFPFLARPMISAAAKSIFNDKSYEDNYKASTYPMEKLVEHLTKRSDDVIRESAGMSPPQGIGEEFAELLPSLLVPLPDQIAKIPKLAKILVHPFLPGVRAEKLGGSYLNAPNALRYGSNVALGGAIVAGVDALKDDEAPLPIPAPSPLGAIPDDSTITSGTDSPPEPVSPTETYQQFEPYMSPEALDEQLQFEEGKRFAIKLSIALGAVAIGLGVTAHKFRADMLKKLAPGEFGVTGGGTVEERKGNFGSWARGSAVDRTTHLRQSLADAEDTAGRASVPAIEEIAVRQIITDASGDALGKAEEFARSGRIGHDFHRQAKTPPTEWTMEFSALSREEQQIFMEAATANQRLIDRIRSTIDSLIDAGDKGAKVVKEHGTLDEMLAYINKSKQDLNKVGFSRDTGEMIGKARLIETDEIMMLVQHLKNPKYRALAEKYGDIFDTLLEYTHFRGAIDDLGMKDARRLHTIDGLLMYMPGVENVVAVGKGYWAKLLESVGINTGHHKFVTSMPSWLSRSTESGGGIKFQMRPGEAMHNAIGRTMVWLDRNAEARNVLFRQTGINNDGVQAMKPSHIPKGPDTPRVVSPDTQFIGARRIGDNSPLEAFIANSPSLTKEVKTLFGVVGDVHNSEAFAAAIGDVLQVHHKGKVYMFHVPNEAMRNVIMTKPMMLKMLNQSARIFKNTLQRFTTGTTVFAPAAMLMNYQQIQFNALVRGVKYNPIDVVKGMAISANFRLSNGLANMITQSILNNTGLAQMYPTHAAKLLETLKGRLSRSLMSTVQRETGSLAMPWLPLELEARMIDLMKMAAPSFGHDMVSLHSLANFLNGIKRVFHEAPVVGLINRQLGGETVVAPQKMRNVVKGALDIAGDTRRHGSSGGAEAFHAWVPWSGPLVQGIDTLSTAIHHAVKTGNKSNILYAAAAVMSPMAGALLWNKFMGEEYNDYYWNNYSDEQRVNNIYLAIPGLPPNRGMLIPLDPLWGMLNAVAIETVDSILGLSSTKMVEQRAGTKATNLNGNHLYKAFARYLDIPVPPAIQAIFAMSMKETMQWRPSYDPSGNMSFGESRSLGSPTKYDTSSSARNIDSGFDIITEGVLRALFGAGAELLISTYDAGRQGFASGGEKQALGYAWDGLTDALARQSRYMQPMFGGMLRVNMNDEISATARAKEKGVDQLVGMFQRNVPGMISLDSALSTEGFDAKTLIADPVFALVVEIGLEPARLVTKIYTDEVQNRQSVLDIAKASGKQNKVALTYKERGRIMEEKTLEIRALGARYVASIQAVEEAVNVAAEKKFGRPINFSFSNYQPRPAPGTGTFLPARRQ